MASLAGAFKAADGTPTYDWFTAPRCLEAPTVFSTNADKLARLWGVELQGSCAFKDAGGDACSASYGTNGHLPADAACLARCLPCPLPAHASTTAIQVDSTGYA